MFKYKAFSPQGKAETGELEARTRAEALRALELRGLIPFEVMEGSAGPAEAGARKAFIDRAPPTSDYALFARELSVLLGAGLALDQALRLLSRQLRRGRVRELTAKVLDRVLAGAALSKALEISAPDAPKMLLSLVRAGEARGQLSTTLAEIAEFLEKSAKLSAKVRSALTYPLVLVGTALIAVAIVISVLVPALMPLFEGNKAEPPLGLRMAANLAALMSTHGMALGAGALATALLLVLGLRSERGQGFVAMLALRMPLIGRVTRMTNAAAFARTLGVLLRHGVPLLQAVEIATDVMTNRSMATGLGGVTEAVRQGSRLAPALGATSVLPELMQSFIAIGEETSRLDQMLIHSAGLLEAEAERAIETGVTLLGPSLTVMVGLLVGGLIISVMQAILGLNELVLK